MPTAVAADPVALANRLRPFLLQINRQLRREVHPLGVTGGQVSLLVAVQRSPDITPAAMRSKMPRCTERIPGTGGDRRRVGLELTADAERVLRLVRSRRTAWLATRLKRLEPEQLDALDAAIEPLAALLQEDE